MSPGPLAPPLAKTLPTTTNLSKFAMHLPVLPSDLQEVTAHVHTTARHKRPVRRVLRVINVEGLHA